jgi:hypothetical protein
LDWLKLLYQEFGARHPVASIVLASILGALLFGGGWWLLGKQYAFAHITVSPIAPKEQPLQPAVGVPSQTEQKSADSTCTNIVSGGNTSVDCPSSQEGAKNGKHSPTNASKTH